MNVTHGVPVHWTPLLRYTMPRWLLLAATLPFALLLATKPPFRSKRDNALIHVALFLAISFAHAAIVAWSFGHESPVALMFPWSARILRAWYQAMPIMVSLYGAVLAAAWALNEARGREQRALRESQLESQLKAAQLAALRARMQPHFLYNTLNGIAALVADSRRDQAVAAIEQLSELLHASLGDDAREVVPVREEFSLAERYLALQRMRFGDRLQYRLSVAPDAAERLVPVLLLQPLVENAVVHGLDAGQQRLHVSVAATAVADRLELRVENDGPSLDQASPSSNGHGVGLAATRARLATAYGDRASLELLPRAGGGVIVRVVLPA